MFEYFTPNAKQAVVAAQDVAIALGHDVIGSGHLLLGLAGAEDSTAGRALGAAGVVPSQARDETVRLLTEAGVPASGGQTAKDALSTLGIDVAEIQRKADDTFGPGAFQFPRPAYDDSAKKALELAVDESRRLGSEQIGTEHMLLGVLGADAGDIAPAALAALGVDTTALRTAVLAGTAGGTGGAPRQPQ